MENKSGFNNTSAGSATDTSLNKASSGAHSAVDRASQMADEAARKAKPAIDKMAGYAHQVVDKAVGAAGPAADWINENTQDLKATQEKMVTATSDYVRANPWKSVGMAVVAGIVLSRIL
jgi:ElaB/YqjD/DUF883 family membrane-anchored ribosome-binding protein